MFGRLAVIFFALIGFLAMVFVVIFSIVQNEYTSTAEFAQGMYVEILGAFATAVVIVLIENLVERTGLTDESVTKADLAAFEKRIMDRMSQLEANNTPTNEPDTLE